MTEPKVAKDGTAVVETDNQELVRRGYRAYVGGNTWMWKAIGELQLDFMIKRGLAPEDTFYDVGCGSLRAGVNFIPYLDTGCYKGIDIEAKLIEVGLEIELDKEVQAEKKPEFVVSDSFEFHKFSAAPDYAIANSLFTHLIPADIKTCLSNLAQVAKPSTQFFATFFECKEPQKNPEVSDAHEGFWYTRAEMIGFGIECGWDVEYIGEWGHPRNQQMMRFF